MKKALLILTIAFAALLPRIAAAQDAAMEQARQHFEQAMDLTDKEDWAGALSEFQKAYEAKPFPAFVYNIAVCYEKLKDYPNAVAQFEKYLAEDPKARDRKEVEKRLAALKAEIAKATQPPPDGTQPPPDGTQPPPDGTQPPPDGTKPGVTPPTIDLLPEAKVRGLVVIESKPAGAAIFVDDKKKGSIGVTPWNGPLDGEHTIILESKGYKTEKKKIVPSGDKLFWLYIALSEEHYLGWLEVRANIPAADVFIDKVDVGAVGRTPFMGNVTPGKHRIIVSREGYTEMVKEIEIEPGKAHSIDVKLEKAPIGFVYVRGETVEGAKVKLDGKEVCKAPCRFQAPEGEHRLTITKGGKKSYSRKLDVRAATETSLQVKLAPKPGHADAYWKFAIGAVFIGGGVFLGLRSDSIYDELRADIMNGNPPIASDDPRFLEGKIYAFAADACYVIGGATILFGIWNLLEDKGPSSTGVAESKDLVFTPTVGPNYAGFSTEWRF